MESSKADLKLLLILLVPVLAAMALHFFITGFVVYNDGRGYYMYVRSAAVDQDLNFSNEWQYYNTTLSKFSAEPIAVSVPPETTPKGYLENIYLIGNSVMWAPFFLASHLIASILHGVGLPVRADGFGTIYEAGIGLASIIYGIIGLWLVYVFSRKWFDRKVSLLATIMVWYGTGVFWYHGVEPAMAHVNSLLLGALFSIFWYNTYGKRTRVQWLLLGLLLGLIYLVRQQDILFGILPAFELAKSSLSSGLSALKKSVANAALFAFGMVASVFPQMLAWKVLYGNFIVYSYASTTKYWHWSYPNMVGIFFNFHHGLWRIPGVIFCLVGLFLFARRVGRLAWLFLAIAIAEIIVTSSWTGWTNGYGVRFLIGVSVFFALGAAELIHRIQERFGTKAAVAVMLLLIAANFANMLLVMLREVTSKVPLSEFLNVLKGML